MKTVSYVRMADLLHELPGITKEVILELVEQNRIPQPIDPNPDEAIIEEGDMLFPSVTRGIIRATFRQVLIIGRGGHEIDLDILVSIAINIDVLPFYSRLLSELIELNQDVDWVVQKFILLWDLHRPCSLGDSKEECAAQYRRYRRSNIADNVMNPAVLNSATRDELEEAIELMKLARPTVPLQDRLNAERKIRTAEQRLAQLDN